MKCRVGNVARPGLRSAVATVLLITALGLPGWADGPDPGVPVASLPLVVPLADGTLPGEDLSPWQDANGHLQVYTYHEDLDTAREQSRLNKRIWADGVTSTAYHFIGQRELLLPFGIWGIAGSVAIRLLAVHHSHMSAQALHDAGTYTGGWILVNTLEKL